MPGRSGRCDAGTELRWRHETGIGEEAHGAFFLLVEYDGGTGLGPDEIADEAVIAGGGVASLAALAVDREAGGGL